MVLVLAGLCASTDCSELSMSVQSQYVSLPSLQDQALFRLHVPTCLVFGSPGLYRHWLMFLPSILLFHLYGPSQDHPSLLVLEEMQLVSGFSFAMQLPIQNFLFPLNLIVL